MRCGIFFSTPTLTVIIKNPKTKKAYEYTHEASPFINEEFRKMLAKAESRLGFRSLNWYKKKAELVKF
ncbi:MAG: hypothetical protein V3S46_07790 [Nitrospinota bacterium]